MPKEGEWGIYKLDLNNEDIALIYNSNNEIEGIKIDKVNRIA